MRTERCLLKPVSSAIALRQLQEAQPVFWLHSQACDAIEVADSSGLSTAEFKNAALQWRCYQPLLKALFALDDFSSPLLAIETYRMTCEPLLPEGSLWLKGDHQLPISGSVKARGALYELLDFACSTVGGFDNPLLLLEEDSKERLSNYQVVVGSTGNLGLAVGKIARTLGFKVSVHMSQDARAWKKDLLCDAGARVVEYAGDYSLAVASARELAGKDSHSYFVDDESSKLLMLGYSLAALELQSQFEHSGYRPTQRSPLVVYLPCGVGGAPVGIAYGLKQFYGNAVQCVIVEPIQAPCLNLALLTGRCQPVSDQGLSGLTQADGLAVGCASALALEVGKAVISGGVTVSDDSLLLALTALYQNEAICIEPSAAAGLVAVNRCHEVFSTDARHLIWSTGGGLLPAEEFQHYLHEVR